MLCMSSNHFALAKGCDMLRLSLSFYPDLLSGLSTKMVKDQINLMNSELSMHESMITSRYN